MAGREVGVAMLASFVCAIPLHAAIVLRSRLLAPPEPAMMACCSRRARRCARRSTAAASQRRDATRSICLATLATSRRRSGTRFAAVDQRCSKVDSHRLVREAELRLRRQAVALRNAAAIRHAPRSPSRPRCSRRAVRIRDACNSRNLLSICAATVLWDILRQQRKSRCTQRNCAPAAALAASIARASVSCDHLLNARDAASVQ